MRIVQKTSEVSLKVSSGRTYNIYVVLQICFKTVIRVSLIVSHHIDTLRCVVHILRACDGAMEWIR